MKTMWLSVPKPGVPREEIGRRITDALTAVNMLEYRRATPHNMSGGQKQRIAIAGILAMKPRVIVLDESTSMLDPAGRRDVMNVVKNSIRKKELPSCISPITWMKSWIATG